MERNPIPSAIQLTPPDAARLRGLLASVRTRDNHDSRNLERLEDLLEDAQVVEDRPGADVVTMGSEVGVTDLDARRALSLSVVYPRQADAEAGRVSVLAPLGMALLGRRVGERIDWEVPGGRRRLRVETVRQP